MIPRILVPKNARPEAFSSDGPPRRTSSDLDVRKLVPGGLPHVELDARSSIPTYFKLEVLGAPVVVPRDNMPTTPLDAISHTPDYVPIKILDSRVVIPKDAHGVEILPKQPVAAEDLPDLIEPDVFNTGEVALMPKAVEGFHAAWNTMAEFASIAFHFLVLLLIIFGPGLFPQRKSTSAEIAKDNITNLYLPNDLKNIPKVTPPPQPKSPVMRVDPRLLQRLAPPRAPQPAPASPEPERSVKESPAPKPSAPSTLPAMPHPQDSLIRPPQTPPENTQNSLVLPRFSPGKALQQSMHDALRDGGGQSAQFGGPAPGGGGMGGSGGPGGQGYLGGQVEMLTPTEGVDFSNYIARVLARVKLNWYAVMPESARLGDRGKVALQFRIMKNGVVPEAEPVMVGSSGKDPLDRAAYSSIRASTPFEELPPAFSGPYIELRFLFLYNIPQNQQ